MTPAELLATVLFGLAVLHTFCVKRFAHWAHQYPPGSVQENLLHFLAETEVVFGLWAAALFFGIAVVKHSVADAVHHIDTLNYTEPKFVFVIMVVAATRPVVKLAETLISLAARLIPAKESVSFYIAALFLGPLLGSFITEPAAMTLLALVLKRRYFDRGISPKLAYATLGLLFVNEQAAQMSHGDYVYRASLYPSLGYNSVFLGGDEQKLNPALAATTFGTDWLVKRVSQIRRPSELIAFVSARSRPGGTRDEFGYFVVHPPYLKTRQWDATFEASRPPEKFGYVHPRWCGRAVVALADGHVESLRQGELQDMRRWCNAADRPDWTLQPSP